VKKYDKAMNEQQLPQKWQQIIDSQPFSQIDDVDRLLDKINSLISRDKLLAWELTAHEQRIAQADALKSVFVSVRMYELVFAVCVLLFTLFVLPLNSAYTIADPASARCLSLLAFVVCLWITQAIPYFATALLVPVLIVVMRVLKDPKCICPAGQMCECTMAPEAAAEYITGSMFNHTTFLLLGMLPSLIVHSC
jgi:phosphate transporter